MANHTLPLPSRLDAQPVLSLRKVNSFIEDRLLTHTERKSGLGSISLVIGCNAARVLPNKPRRILKESLAKVMLPPLLTAMGAEFSSWPCHLRKHWL